MLPGYFRHVVNLWKAVRQPSMPATLAHLDFWAPALASPESAPSGPPRSPGAQREYRPAATLMVNAMRFMANWTKLGF